MCKRGVVKRENKHSIQHHHHQENTDVRVETVSLSLAEKGEAHLSTNYLWSHLGNRISSLDGKKQYYKHSQVLVIFFVSFRPFLPVYCGFPSFPLPGTCALYRVLSIGRLSGSA